MDRYKVYPLADEAGVTGPFFRWERVRGHKIGANANNPRRLGLSALIIIEAHARPIK